MVDEKTIKAAVALLEKGYCVKVHQIKDGAKVAQIIRKRVKQKQNKE